MRIAQAARGEWAEATAAAAEAAGVARAELSTRGAPRWDEPRQKAQAAEVPAAQAGEVPGTQAVDPAQAERWRSAQAELADLIGGENRTLDRMPEAERETLPDSLRDWMDQRMAELARADAEAEADASAWPEAQAELEADIDPEALTVMAAAEAAFGVIDDNLARAQAGIAQRDEQRDLERAERERAAVDEPVVHTDVQAGVEAEAIAAKAEADSDPDLEI
jgi:hypothetical protein